MERFRSLCEESLLVEEMRASTVNDVMKAKVTSEMKRFNRPDFRFL